MEALPPPGHIDMSRPECRGMAAEMRELERQRRYWAGRLQSATTHDERKGILATIDGLENSIQNLEERLFEEGCYIGPVPPVVAQMLEIVHIELTQSIQYYGVAGSGAARDNSIQLIQDKPLMVRAYV